MAAEIDPKKPPEFEAAYAALETVVRKLETGDATLEESLELFEKGVRLARICSKQLDQAEKRIEILVDPESGETVPFEHHPDKEAMA